MEGPGASEDAAPVMTPGQRVQELLEKLEHPLEEVRTRALENLASKARAGIIAASEVACDARSREALQAAASVAVGDATLSGPGGASRAGQAQLVLDWLDGGSGAPSGADMESVGGGGGESATDSGPSAPVKTAEVGRREAIGRAVARATAGATGTTQAGTVRGLDRVAKFGGHWGADTRHWGGDSLFESTEPRGWCFPWVDLSKPDEQTLFDLHILFKLDDDKSRLTACNQLKQLFLRDFPAPVFLQHPVLLQHLVGCIRTAEMQAELGRQMFAVGMEALDLMVRNVRLSLSDSMDPDVQAGTGTNAGGSASSARPRMALGDFAVLLFRGLSSLLEDPEQSSRVAPLLVHALPLASAMTDRDRESLSTVLVDVRRRTGAEAHEVNSIVQRLKSAAKHTDFREALRDLTAACEVSQEVAEIVAHGVWGDVMYRFLTTAPTCPRDEVTLAQVVSFTATIVPAMDAGQVIRLCDALRDHLCKLFTSDSLHRKLQRALLRMLERLASIDNQGVQDEVIVCLTDDCGILAFLASVVGTHYEDKDHELRCEALRVIVAVTSYSATASYLLANVTSAAPDLQLLVTSLVGVSTRHRFPDSFLDKAPARLACKALANVSACALATKPGWYMDSGSLAWLMRLINDREVAIRTCALEVLSALLGASWARPILQASSLFSDALRLSMDAHEPPAVRAECLHLLSSFVLLDEHDDSSTDPLQPFRESGFFRALRVSLSDGCTAAFAGAAVRLVLCIFEQAAEATEAEIEASELWGALLPLVSASRHRELPSSRRAALQAAGVPWELCETTYERYAEKIATPAAVSCQGYVIALISHAIRVSTHDAIERYFEDPALVDTIVNSLCGVVDAYQSLTRKYPGQRVRFPSSFAESAMRLLQQLACYEGDAVVVPSGSLDHLADALDTLLEREEDASVRIAASSFIGAALTRPNWRRHITVGHRAAQGLVGLVCGVGASDPESDATPALEAVVSGLRGVLEHSDSAREVGIGKGLLSWLVRQLRRQAQGGSDRIRLFAGLVAALLSGAEEGPSREACSLGLPDVLQTLLAKTDKHFVNQQHVLAAVVNYLSHSDYIKQSIVLHAAQRGASTVSTPPVASLLSQLLRLSSKRPIDQAVFSLVCQAISSFSQSPEGCKLLFRTSFVQDHVRFVAGLLNRTRIRKLPNARIAAIFQVFTSLSLAEPGQSSLFRGTGLMALCLRLLEVGAAEVQLAVLELLRNCSFSRANAPHFLAATDVVDVLLGFVSADRSSLARTAAALVCLWSLATGSQKFRGHLSAQRARMASLVDVRTELLSIAEDGEDPQCEASRVAIQALDVICVK